MGIVQHAVTDRIGHVRIADVRMPGLGRQLAGNDRRARAVAIFEDLQEIAPLLILKRGEAPVVALCGAPHKSTNVERAVMWRGTETLLKDPCSD